LLGFVWVKYSKIDLRHRVSPQTWRKGKMGRGLEMKRWCIAKVERVIFGPFYKLFIPSIKTE
jgi:hypothetical protein